MEFNGIRRNLTELQKWKNENRQELFATTQIIGF